MKVGAFGSVGKAALSANPAGAALVTGVSALKKKKKAKKAARGVVTGRRRPRRIVFSENQWQFVQSLVRMAGHHAPSFPHKRRRSRRKW